MNDIELRYLITDVTDKGLNYCDLIQKLKGVNEEYVKLDYFINRMRNLLPSTKTLDKLALFKLSEAAKQEFDYIFEDKEVNNCEVGYIIDILEDQRADRYNAYNEYHKYCDLLDVFIDYQKFLITMLKKEATDEDLERIEEIKKNL